jgi:hypothetical protein
MRVPDSVPDTTFPSGISANPVTSDSSSCPNFPISPYSLRPVNVYAILQNLICPLPDVNNISSVNGENDVLNISYENAFPFSTTLYAFQSQTVRV